MKNKDDKVFWFTSIDDFMNLISDNTNIKLFTGGKPTPNTSYLYIDNYILAYIKYGKTLKNYGTTEAEKLEYICAFKRDGTSEYALNTIQNCFSNKSVKQKLAHLPQYKAPSNIVPINSTFTDNIIDTGYVTPRSELKDTYVVLDVETNGLRKAVDDLISISIYSPDTGLCYNRVLPLELQPVCLTTWVHGLSTEQLRQYSPLTQKELDEVIKTFDLEHKTILSYSGGQGLFDITFIQNYMARHKLVGLNNVNLQNIKALLPQCPYGYSGTLSKDNLCEAFGITGTSNIHSSYNDCLLEWKLFEKIYNHTFLFRDKYIYQYNPDYIIPFSVLIYNRPIQKASNIELPHISSDVTELYRLSCNKKLLKDIKKFPTNITGITIEHAINTKLEVKQQNTFEWQQQNFAKLTKVGTLPKEINTIPLLLTSDGLVKEVYAKDIKIIEDINNTNKAILQFIEPLITYIKDNLFTKTINSQELVIQDNIFTLCDLSDDKSVMEIKTGQVVTTASDGTISLSDNTNLQLWYQHKNRNTYLLSVQFNEKPIAGQKWSFEKELVGLNIVIYKVVLHDTTLQHNQQKNDEKEKFDRFYAKLSKHLIDDPDFIVCKNVTLRQEFTKTMFEKEPYKAIIEELLLEEDDAFFEWCHKHYVFIYDNYLCQWMTNLYRDNKLRTKIKTIKTQ